MSNLTITPEREKEYREKIKTLRYLDDDFFNACLQDNPDAALLILRIVMRKKDLVFVKKSETQKTIKALAHKSIRLDLYAESEKKRYDVEIQRSERGAGAHRARYYSSLMDANISMPGEDYDILPDTYVIFITEKDVFDEGKPYYEIDRMIQESGREFGDGSHILYVNGAYEGDDDIGKLMHDFRCVNPHDMYYKELRDTAIYLKEDEKGVEQMCRAIEEITNEAVKENKQETALKMIKDGVLSIDKIAQYSGLSKTEIEQLKKDITVAV